MQVELKTILNAVQPFPGFVYQDTRCIKLKDTGAAGRWAAESNR